MASAALEGLKPSEEQLLRTLLGETDPAALAPLLEENWEELARDGTYVACLQQLAQGGAEAPAAQRVLQAMEGHVERMVTAGRDRLRTLLQCPSQAQFEEQLRAMSQRKELNMAFVRVLDANIDAAEETQNTELFNLLKYVRSRCVEMVESNALPGDRLVSQALRQPDSAARLQLLSQHLVPKEGEEFAEVTVAQFAGAIVETVKRLRAMDIGAEELAATLGNVRALALDGRTVLMHYGGEKLRFYEQQVARVFPPEARAI